MLKPLEDEEERWLSCRQVQYVLNCGRPKLDEIRKSGALPAVKHGNKWVFSYRRVRIYMEEKMRERDKEYREVSIRRLNAIIED